MPRLTRPRPARPAGQKKAGYVVVRGSKRNPSPLAIQSSETKAKQLAKWLAGHFPGANVRVQATTRVARNAAPLSKSVGARELDRKWFAYVGDPARTATWKLPIFTASHVRNALARFGRTQLPRQQRAAVLARIQRRARQLGVHYGGSR